MIPSPQEHTLVAIYGSPAGAEAGVRALQRAGVDMNRLSIVGKDFHAGEHALGFYTSGDRIVFWGAGGAFWGALWAMLCGGAFFFIPAVGPFVVMGPLVGWIVAALEGAALGGPSGALGAALSTIGIPHESIESYELDLHAGKYLLLIQGPMHALERACAALGPTGASQLAAHAA